MLVLSAFLKSEYLHQEDTLALLRSMSAFGDYKGRSKLLFLNPVLHLHTLGTACILCYWFLDIPEIALSIHSFSNHSVQPTRVPKRLTSLENFLAGNFQKVLPFCSKERTKAQ